MSPQPGLSPEATAQREAANGLRQTDEAISVIQYYLDPQRPFVLNASLLQHLQRIAVDGIRDDGGQWRTGAVSLTGSAHVPPDAFRVPTLVQEMCDFINDNFHERTAFWLSAYVMWRLNWIHPFADGNGRTARVLSYIVLCVKLGYVLPGTPTIPDQLKANRDGYLAALAAADEAEARGELDFDVMETLLKGMLANQLLSVIEAADGQGRPAPV